MFSVDFETGTGGVGWIVTFGLFFLSSLCGLFSLILKSNALALGLILTTAFTRVVFHLVGLPRVVPTLFTEFCVLLLLVKALYLQLIIYNRPVRTIGFLPMVGILVVTIFSYSYNQPGMLPAIFFVRQIFVFYLFFIALLNLNLSDSAILKINKLVIFLFLIQLPAAAVKLVLVGQREGLGIGTVAWQASEFSTTLPLFAMAFLLSFYFFRKDKKYLLLIAGFLLFGIAGKKRALALLIPLISGVVWYLYGKREVFNRGLVLSVSQMKYFLVICVTVFVGIFASSRWLNDEMYGGGLDVRRIVDYIIWYNTRDYIALYGPDDPDHTMGRVTITRLSLKALKEGGPIQQLIGFGPGAMIRSHHLGRKEVAFERFGIRGAVTGFIVLVLQVGFLGVLFITLFFLNLFKRTYILYQRSPNPDYKMIALGFLGATFLFLLDFFVYSQSTLYFGVLTPVYFYVASIVLKREHHGIRLPRLCFLPCPTVTLEGLASDNSEQTQ